MIGLSKFQISGQIKVPRAYDSILTGNLFPTERRLLQLAIFVIIHVLKARRVTESTVIGECRDQILNFRHFQIQIISDDNYSRTSKESERFKKKSIKYESHV